MTPPLPFTPPNFIVTDTSILPLNKKQIEVNLNEDNAVCGFGELIPVSNAKMMVKDYFDDFDAIEAFISLINSTAGVPDIIKLNPGFIALSNLFQEANHTVSGVFGKELILQILSQKKCEGIRYFIGKYNGKPTVIIAGVRNEEVDLPGDGHGIQINTNISEMIPDAATFLNIKYGIDSDRSNPPTGEVHGSSKTVKEIREMILPENQKQAGFTEELEKPANKVFLSY